MNNRKLDIERTFDAPINDVWEAFTTTDILARWWFPDGMTNTHVSADVREGGEFRFCFTTDGGKEYWGKGIYQTISEPTYLSYFDTFTDADGNPVPPSHYGMPGDEIVPSLVEITLTEADGRTHMELSMDNPYDDAMTGDMTDGWNSMFDNLGTNLKR